MNVRAVSFPGWALPWYQWTFYNVDDENGASYISTCMDIFGLTFFMSLPFSFLPQLIIWICGKLGNIQKGKNQFRTILKDYLGTIFFTISKARTQLCRIVKDSPIFPTSLVFNKKEGRSCHELRFGIRSNGIFLNCTNVCILMWPQTSNSQNESF